MNIFTDETDSEWPCEKVLKTDIRKGIKTRFSTRVVQMLYHLKSKLSVAPTKEVNLKHTTS